MPPSLALRDVFRQQMICIDGLPSIPDYGESDPAGRACRFGAANRQAQLSLKGSSGHRTPLRQKATLEA